MLARASAFVATMFGISTPETAGSQGVTAVPTPGELTITTWPPCSSLMIATSNTRSSERVRIRIYGRLWGANNYQATDYAGI